MSSLLKVKELSKDFYIRVGLLGKKVIRAVRDVSFGVERGRIMALVGESGSGKSTVGKIILRLEEPTKGSVEFEGRNINTYRKEYTRFVSVVFQDPSNSLNPFMKVKDIVEEPLVVHGFSDRKERVERALELANLGRELINRRPSELSGGQRQRVAIARAVVLDTKLIVADEPTASLDASIRRSILELFLKLKESGISTLLITHDIRSVERVADSVGVMYKGMLVELGDKDGVIKNPKHPYTRYLLESVPVRHPSQRRHVRKEEITQSPEEGCPFYPLCPERLKSCTVEVKEVLVDGAIVKCNLY